jgi:hypothetical protein
MCPNPYSDLEEYIRPVFKRISTSKIHRLLQRKNKSTTIGLVINNSEQTDEIGIQTVLRNGRFKRLFCIVATPLEENPDLYSQVDYAFASKNTTRDERIRLWQTFFIAFPTFDDFEEVLDSTDYLVYDNVTSQICWYENYHRVPEFKFGQQDKSCKMCIVAFAMLSFIVSSFMLAAR